MKYIYTRNFHTSFEHICLEDNVPVPNCHEKEAVQHGPRHAGQKIHK